MNRTAFFVSDGTGTTASSLGGLLAHFPNTQFEYVRLPFTDTAEKVEDAQKRIAETKVKDNVRPVVIMSIGDVMLRNQLKEVDAFYIDLFDSFIDPLGKEFNEKPLTGASIAHGNTGESYHARIDAINFSLNHDDGITNNGLEEAQVILIGVSRCGKTPTSLYLAMQYSIKAANYPLIPEDFERGTLPAALIPHRHKIFGLSIQPERLHSVRTERRPDSFYASIDNCRKEIATAERMMKNAGITWTDSSTRSIEELSAIILQKIRQPAK